MSSQTLKIPKSVVELIRHLHPQIKRKIRAALTEILDDRHCGKPLKRELTGYWSLRVSQYRIIYRPDEAGAEIVAIGPRKTIYEDIARHVRSSRS